VLGVSVDSLLGPAAQATPPAVTSPPLAAQHAGRAANGAHTAEARDDVAEVATPAVPPDPSRFPTMCPHCYASMVPMDDGQGLVCPGCRYKREGDT
jgi:hypothetical protein